MSDPTGYRESPDTTDPESGDNLVDGLPGKDPSDGGERETAPTPHTPLTTDDEAQRDDSVARPGNAAS